MVRRGHKQGKSPPWFPVRRHLSQRWPIDHPLPRAPAASQVGKSRLPKHDSDQLFHMLETEIMSLHGGNIARFKILPHEFQVWKDLRS